MLAPLPINKLSPRQDSVSFDMLTKPSFLPENKISNDEFSRLVKLSSSSGLPAIEIVVRPNGSKYEVLYGYEAYLAYKSVSKTNEVAVSVYHYSDEEAFVFGMTQNRINFNENPFSAAEAYNLGMKEFGWSRAELSKVLGIGRSTVTNRLSILNCDNTVRVHFERGQLGLEHIKTLSRLNKELQRKLCSECVNNQWTSSALYKAIHPDWVPKNRIISNLVATPKEKDSDIIRLEKIIGDKLGCPASFELDATKGFKGEIKLGFFDSESLLGVAEILDMNKKRKGDFKGEVSLKIDGLDMLERILSSLG